MKEISLKEWSAMLPTWVMCEVTDKGDKKIAKLCGVYDCGELVFHDIVESHQGFGSVKPILRDLSDLIKEDFKEEILSYFESLGIDVKIVKYDSGNNKEDDFTLAITYKLMGECFTDILINRGSTEDTPRHFFDWLCEQKFNVFQLPNELIIKVTEDFNPYE